MERNEEVDAKVRGQRALWVTQQGIVFDALNGRADCMQAKVDNPDPLPLYIIVVSNQN